MYPFIPRIECGKPTRMPYLEPHLAVKIRNCKIFNHGRLGKKDPLVFGTTDGSLPRTFHMALSFFILLQVKLVLSKSHELDAPVELLERLMWNVRFLDGRC